MVATPPVSDGTALDGPATVRPQGLATFVCARAPPLGEALRKHTAERFQLVVPEATPLSKTDSSSEDVY